LCFCGIFSFFLIRLAFNFNLDFFNHRLNNLLGNDRLADDNWLLHVEIGRLPNALGVFRRFHHNRLRNEWNSWIDDLRLENLGLGLDLADFDVELDFAVRWESDCVGHLQIRIVFNIDPFVVGVEVDDVEVADLGDGKLVDELAALDVQVLVRLDGRDSLEGSFVVDEEGQLDV